MRQDRATLELDQRIKPFPEHEEEGGEIHLGPEYLKVHSNLTKLLQEAD
jgi:hypothetical protein